MALKKSQRSLKAWGKQKWRTKSGKPSTQGPKATGERYLPEKRLRLFRPLNTPALRLRSVKQLNEENKWLNSPKRLLKKRQDIENLRKVKDKLEYGNIRDNRI